MNSNKLKINSISFFITTIIFIIIVFTIKYISSIPSNQNEEQENSTKIEIMETEKKSQKFSPSLFVSNPIDKNHKNVL